MVEDKKNISFDFDYTLSLEWVRNNLYEPLSNSFNIIIVTSRDSKKENRELWSLCDELGIDKKNVYFTDGRLKSDVLDKLKCVMHFDDNFIEIADINNKCRCKGIMIDYKM